MSFTAELAARLSALDADEVVADDLVPVATRPSATAALHIGPSVATAAGVVAVTTPLVVGRAAAGNDVDVALPSTLVSRRHVTVWAAGDALLCRDLGSTNGTVLVRDGERHPVGGERAALLVPGDVLVTAEGIELLTVVEG